MNENGGIQAVMPVGGNCYGGACDGWGGMNGLGGIVGLLAVLGIIGGGFGNGWGNRGDFGYHPQYATQDFVQNGFNFNDLQDQNRDILGAINDRAAEAIAATNQVYHDTVSYVGDKYDELARDVAGLAVGQANLLAKQNECCCQQLRAIDGVNYNASMNTAAIQRTIVEEGQKTRDLITTNKMDEMQHRIDHLELEKEMAGVVRYPNGWVYSAGRAPFCGNGGCCGGGFAA